MYNYSINVKGESSKTEKSVIVIDIGGTNFRSSVFIKGKGLIEKPQIFLTPNFINHPNLDLSKLQELLINRVIDIIKDYQKKIPGLKIVGLSFPAPITSTGIVNQASTVWGNRGKNFPLLKRLSQANQNIYWVITNDITAAAERYASMEKYQNIDYFAVITISSGIGSKIYDVKNKKVILDKRSIGGEMGHIKVDFSSNAPICDCGGKGHLGAISSGRAIERIAIAEAKKIPASFKKSLLFSTAQNPEQINNKHLANAIKNGDSFSLQILDRATFPLACSIAHISGNIGVGKFIIIGGFALNCGNNYLRSLKSNLLKTDFYSREKKEILNLVELGINDDSDSLIGVGLLAQKQHAENA